MIGFIAVMAITILFPVWVYSLNHELYSNIQIALTRFPIFVFGVFMGKEIKNGVRIPWLLVLDIIAIGFIAEYLLLFEFRGVNSYVARNVASIFSVSLLIILTLLCQLLGKCKWLMKILRQQESIP